MNKATDSNTKFSYAELDLNPAANRLLEFFLMIDVYMIKAGLSLPWGGSLIAVAQKSPEKQKTD